MSYSTKLLSGRLEFSLATLSMESTALYVFRLFSGTIDYFLASLFEVALIVRHLFWDNEIKNLWTPWKSSDLPFSNLVALCLIYFT